MARPLSITLEIEANELRRRIALGDTAPVDTRKALQQLGVLCVFMPMQETFSGMCLKHKEKRFMLVNSKVALGRQHFTIAHELYHLYLDENPHPHVCIRDGKKDRTEVLADAFASALLLPREGVLKAIPNDEIRSRNVSLATVFSLEQYFRVSHQSVVFRLKRLSLITEEMLQYLLSIKIREVAPQYGIFDMSLYEKGNENVILSDYGFKAKLLFDKEKISDF